MTSAAVRFVAFDVLVQHVFYIDELATTVLSARLASPESAARTLVDWTRVRRHKKRGQRAIFP
jgi:hypothetical protein